jgi:steroid delta-isomerase-like uncharacterized protein
MSQQTVVHRWFEEVWNQGRESAIEELMAPDGQAHGLSHASAAPVKGHDAFKDFYRQFRAAFSDIHIAIEDTICEGDKVVVRCLVTARHSGDGLAGPATGKTVEFGGVCLARVQGGKLVEAWNNFDFLGMFQQVGLTLR